MLTTTTQLVVDAKSRIQNLDPEQTARELADGALLVDIREAIERDDVGGIPGAVHVPRGLLEFKADPALPGHLPALEPRRRTILYCAVGGRSALAVLSLRCIGYSDVAHLDGGIQAWMADGRPVEVTQ